MARKAWHLNRDPRPGEVYAVVDSVTEALDMLKRDGRNPNLFTTCRTEGLGVVVRYYGTTHEQRAA